MTEHAKFAISIPLPCGCVLRHTVEETPQQGGYDGPEGDAFLSYARALLGYWFRNHAAQHRCPEQK